MSIYYSYIREKIRFFTFRRHQFNSLAQLTQKQTQKTLKIEMNQPLFCLGAQVLNLNLRLVKGLEKRSENTGTIF